MRECQSLAEVRESIDAIDREIVGLLAQRGDYVRQAAVFKQTTEDVKAPQRVEAVVKKVRNLASERGAEPEVVERVYREMISAFVAQEMQEHSKKAGDE